MEEKKSKAIEDDTFLRALVHRQLQITRDEDNLRKLVSKGTQNETVLDVLEDLKDLFTPLADEITLLESKLAVCCGQGTVCFEDDRISKKQKQSSPPTRPKLPVDVGNIIPPHFFTRFAQWFQIMPQCSDLENWTAEQKKSMDMLINPKSLRP